MSKKYIVYMHKNIINDKIYIGITCREPQKRWNYGRGYQQNRFFENAIQKYGWKNFEHIILYENLPEEEAKAKEIELISKYKSNNRKCGYNISSGGESGNGVAGKNSLLFGVPKTLEHRKKLSMAKKGKPSHRRGLHLSNETKEKLRQANKGKTPITAGFNRRIVKCIETGKVYYSCLEAWRQTGIHYSNISRCCLNKRQTAGKLHWEYI